MIRLLLVPILSALVMLSVAAALPAAAQQPDGGGSLASPHVWETAPVIVDGRTLFRLRGATALPAAERAAGVSSRIIAIAKDPAIDPASITIAPGAFGYQVGTIDTRIVIISPADAELEGIEEDTLADISRKRIVQAIESYRSERSAESLQSKAIFALIAVVVTIVAVAGFLLATRWLLKVASRRYKRYIEAIKIQSFRLVRAEQIYAILRGFLLIVRSLLVVVMVYICLVYVLGLFPWTRIVSRSLVDYLIGPLHTILTATLDSIPNLVIIALIYLLTRAALRLIQVLFRALEYRYISFSGFEHEWARPTHRLVRLAVIAFAFVIAYPYIPGSDSAAFKGATIFAGVILSLGSSSIIANIIAGYSMIYRRAFAVGDWIKVGESIGEVIEQRLLVTHLRSPKNEAVVVPNSQIMNEEVINYSSLARKRGLILHPTVSIGYEVPWRQVEAMLIEAARRSEGIAAEPEPFVLVPSLGDFAVVYELNAVCRDPQNMPRAYASLHRHILDVFNENGVQIMTPHYVADTEAAKIVPRDRWYDKLADPGQGGALAEAPERA